MSSENVCAHVEARRINDIDAQIRTGIYQVQSSVPVKFRRRIRWHICARIISVTWQGFPRTQKRRTINARLTLFRAYNVENRRCHTGFNLCVWHALLVRLTYFWRHPQIDATTTAGSCPNRYFHTTTSRSHIQVGESPARITSEARYRSTITNEKVLYGCCNRYGHFPRASTLIDTAVGAPSYDHGEPRSVNCR